MKGNFFSSIRFRSYLLYVLVLGFALFFHNALTFIGFREALERKVDELLAAKVQAVESMLRTYREGRQTAQSAPERNWFSDLFRSPGASPGSAQDPYEMIFRHLTRDTLTPDASDPRIAIDVYSADGMLADSSSHGPNLLRLGPVVRRRTLAGEKVFYSYSLKAENGREVRMRAMTKLLRDERDQRATDILQIRIPLQNVIDQERQFVLQLLLRSLLVILMASGGGLILVKFTLRPVDRMTQTIRNIKPENLDQRLRVPETGDEIARLAETFNAMLERLDKSFRSQRQIVQDISHELKTPLTIIRGQMEVALKKKRSTAEYEEILQSALEEIQKVRRIVDNLLLLARFDSPGHTLERQPVSLRKVLDDVLQDVRIACLEKEIEVQFPDGKDVVVQGNEVHLDRLFRNLLENACKYNVPRGRIEVLLREEQGTAWVEIHDTGIGIANAEIDKVFDRFYRVDQARSAREGFGLGLSIAKSIVEAHGGRIQLQSSIGAGTTFRVGLPLPAEMAASGAD